MRVTNVVDLVAAEAIYHHSCHLQFFLKTPTTGQRGHGKPEDVQKATAFKPMCQYLEDSEECQFSMTELIKHLVEIASEEFRFTTKWLKKKLIDHYGCNITITEVPGQVSNLSFRDTDEKILHEKWYTDRKTKEVDERLCIIEAAAAIIREDIRCKIYQQDKYYSAIEIIAVLQSADIRKFVDCLWMASH